MKIVLVILLLGLLSCNYQNEKSKVQIEKHTIPSLRLKHKIIEVYNDSMEQYKPPIASYIIDSNGNNIFNRTYDLIKTYSNNPMYIYTYDNDKIGIINEDLKVIFEPIFSGIRFSSYDSILLLRKDSLWGVVHLNGDVKIPFIYTEIISDKYFRCRKDVYRSADETNWDVYDSDFNKKNSYDNIYLEDGVNNFDFSIGYIASRKGKYAILNNDLKETTVYKYDSIYSPYDFEPPHLSLDDIIDDITAFIVKVDGSFSLIKFNGKKLTPDINCDDLKQTNDYDKFIMRKENKYGVVNLNGKIIINPVYNSILEISHLDKYTPNNLIRPSLINTFDKSVLFYTTDSVYGIIFNGKVISKYNDFVIYKNLSSQLYAIKNKKGEWSICNTKNSLTSPFEYDSLEILKIVNFDFFGTRIEERIIKTKKKNLYGLISSDGKVLLDNIYTKLSITNYYDIKNNNSLKIALIDSNNSMSNYEFKSSSID